MQQVLYSTYSFLPSYSSSLDSPGQWPAYVSHLSLQLSTPSVPGMTLVSSLHLQSPFILLWVELFQNLQPDGQLQHLVCHLRPAKRAGLWPQPIFFFTSPIPRNTTSRGHAANGQIAAQLQTDLFSWALVNGEFCYVHQARPWEYCGGPYWSTPSSAGWVFCVLILPDLSILVFLLWTVPPSPQSAFGLPAHKMKG